MASWHGPYPLRGNVFPPMMEGEPGEDGLTIPGKDGAPGCDAPFFPGMDGEDGEDGFFIPPSSSTPSLGDVFAVTNNSGSTANANDVGYIGTDGKYTTTTTQGADVSWCVVAVGGGNAATIYVQRSGLATIKCDASNSVGDWLITSSTATQAHSNGSDPHYAMFAKVVTANSGGAGGTCTALLYCRTRFVPASSTNNVIQLAGSSAFPSTTTTISSGAGTTTPVLAASFDCLNNNSVNELAKQILWNTTRSTGALVTAFNTGTKTPTLVAAGSGWVNGDTVTVQSQTVVTGGSPVAIDLDFSQSTSTIPATARAVLLRVQAFDSGAAPKTVRFLPYETYSIAKAQSTFTQVAGQSFEGPVTIKLINQRCAWTVSASGAATAAPTIRLAGYEEACP